MARSTAHAQAWAASWRGRLYARSGWVSSGMVGSDSVVYGSPWRGSARFGKETLVIREGGQNSVVCCGEAGRGDVWRGEVR